LRSEISLEEAIELTKKDTRHYAKRQITWFRKMESIQWYDPGDIEAIKGYIAESLR
jgi:tRNA dimethylallyltransferase